MKIFKKTIPKDCTIYWIRHANSCSNDYDIVHNPQSPSPQIVPIDDTTDDDDDDEDDEDTEDENTEEGGRTTSDSPIHGGSDAFSNLLNSGRRRFGNILDAARRKTEKSLLIRHSNKLYQPALTYLGITQSIMLGCNAFCTENYTHPLSKYENDNLINISKIKKIYCSPSLRTLMTAILSLRNINNYTAVQIIICPFIIENKNWYSLKKKTFNWISDFPGTDLQNDIVSIRKLSRLVNMIINWLKNEYINNFIDYEINNILIEIKKIISIQLEYNCDSLKSNFDINTIIENITNKLKETKQLHSNDIDKINKLIFELNKFNTNELINFGTQLHKSYIYNININYWDINDNRNDFNKFLNSIPNINIYGNWYREKSKYDALTNEEKMYFLNTRDDLKLFYDYINYTDEDVSNILCFSHGAKIKTYFNRYNTLNTLNGHTSINDNKVFKDALIYINGKGKMRNTQIIKTKYSNNIPTFDICIEDYYQFILLNKVLLSPYKSRAIESAKICNKVCGVIGYLISETSSLTLMNKIKEIMDDPSEKKMDKQRQIYEDSRNWTNLGPIGGGSQTHDPYLNKYLKYKNKYLKLKELHKNLN